jgi:hypothetical protein
MALLQYATWEQTVLKKIFLSYRHEDAGHAGRVMDKLVLVFGEEHLFMDVDGLRAGIDFREQLFKALSDCAVLLALIGPQWLDARDRNNNRRRRINNPEDWVRIEIGTALKRGVPVIPVLLDGTKIPEANLLPKDVRGLSTKQATEVRSKSFRDDMDRLVRELNELPDRPRGVTSWAGVTIHWYVALPWAAWAVGTALACLCQQYVLSPLGRVPIVLFLEGCLFAVPLVIPSRWLPTEDPWIGDLLAKVTYGFLIGFLCFLSAWGWSTLLDSLPTFFYSWFFLTAVSKWLLRQSGRTV